jgi:hypothetical protein
MSAEHEGGGRGENGQKYPVIPTPGTLRMGQFPRDIVYGSCIGWSSLNQMSLSQ